MVNSLPRWVMERYAKLWKKYEDKPFVYEDIGKVLKMDDKNIISVFMNELKNAGWVDVNLHPEDSRKREYALKNPEKAIQALARER